MSLQFATFRYSFLISCSILLFGFSAIAQGGFNPNLPTISGGASGTPNLNTQNLQVFCNSTKAKQEYKKYIEFLYQTPRPTIALNMVDAEFTFSSGQTGRTISPKKQARVTYRKERVLLCKLLRSDQDKDPVFDLEAGTVKYDGVTYPMIAQGNNVFFRYSP